MANIDFKNDYDRWFQIAFKYELERKWRRKQYVLAMDCGFNSSGFISDIKSGNNFPSRNNQLKIVKAMGFDSLEEFWKIGQIIEKTGMPPEEKYPPNGTKIIEFPNKDRHSLSPRLEKMIRNLIFIVSDGDDETISAIEMNLITFKKRVEDHMEIIKMKEEIEVLKSQKKKNGG